SLSVLLRATTRTEQPTDPKRRAIPRPIPLLAPVTTAVRPASELNIESSVLLVGGPPQANLEASTERPPSNMRNQPNPGDAQGTCYTPRGVQGFWVAVSARIDWRCQPGVVAPHADRASCFWRKGRRDGRRALVPRSGKPGWRRGRLPLPLAARTAAEGLIGPFSFAFLPSPPPPF